MVVIFNLLLVALPITVIVMLVSIIRRESSPNRVHPIWVEDFTYNGFHIQIWYDPFSTGWECYAFNGNYDELETDRESTKAIAIDIIRKMIDEFKSVQILSER